MTALKNLLISSILVFIIGSLPAPVFAQEPPIYQTFYKAKVEKIIKTEKQIVAGKPNLSQNIQTRLLDGPDKGTSVVASNGGMFTITTDQLVTVGDTIILRRTEGVGIPPTYYVADQYRIPQIVGILIAFFLIVILIAGRKGTGAIIGMLFSLGMIMWFIIPQILHGSDPLLISILGSIIILGVTMYLAHGFTKQTHIALVATALSLFLTAFFAILFVHLTKLSGLGSEDAYSLQQGFSGVINFRGLLLGGIIIGTLGVLDDVTTTQATTIHELSEANHKATFEGLITQGMRVGREHIASVVNTLVLAYAGASIGIFIYLQLGSQQQTQPLWVMLNSEVIMEEVIRTLAGSLGLILAVPITTIIAAFFAKNEIKVT